MIDLVFRRLEQKYLLNEAQTKELKKAMDRYMEPDKFSTSAIRNVYYDTPDYRLIRRSLEKPEYKEKLRLRSYGDAKPDSRVFLEMKKKYAGIIYKRRIALRADEAMAYMADPNKKLNAGQIGREIDYFKSFYGDLFPAVYLSYDRHSWRGHDGQLRVTLDRNIQYRTEDVNLTAPCCGEQLLEPGYSLLEIKTPKAIPLWFVRLLSDQQIRQVSFSKYGCAYTRLLTQHKLESRGFHYA